MATITVTTADAARLKTVLSMLGRGKFELEGMEILASAQAFGWAGELGQRIASALANPPPAADTPQEAAIATPVVPATTAQPTDPRAPRSLRRAG